MSHKLHLWIGVVTFVALVLAFTLGEAWGVPVAAGAGIVTFLVCLAGSSKADTLDVRVYAGVVMGVLALAGTLILPVGIHPWMRWIAWLWVAAGQLFITMQILDCQPYTIGLRTITAMVLSAVAGGLAGWAVSLLVTHALGREHAWIAVSMGLFTMTLGYRSLRSLVMHAPLGQ